MIIGIDPSIRTTGFAAIYNDKRIYNLMEIRPSPKNAMQQRLADLFDMVKQDISKCNQEEKITKIIIEKPPDYVASYGGRKKSVVSMIHLCFSFGTILGACLASVPSSIIECIPALHKEGRRWVGIITKRAAFNTVKCAFPDLEKFINKYTGKKESYLYNMTDALMLAFWEWNCIFGGKKNGKN